MGRGALWDLRGGWGWRSWGELGALWVIWGWELCGVGGFIKLCKTMGEVGACGAGLWEAAGAEGLWPGRCGGLVGAEGLGSGGWELWGSGGKVTLGPCRVPRCCWVSWGHAQGVG